KWNRKVNIIIFFLLILLIFGTLVSFLSIISTNSNIDNNQVNPKINDFSKEDYDPILEEKKHGLGNITIYNMTFNGLEIGRYIRNASYPLLWYDYESGALNITSKEIKFIETNESARIDNLNSELSDRNEIGVELNETLKVWYDNPNEGYLIYRVRLYPCYLTNIYVFDGTDISELSLDTDYYIDDQQFMVFDYRDYFNKGTTFNFTMYLIYEYNITIDPWTLNQYPDKLNMTKEEQTLTAEFNYEFTLTGQMWHADTNQKRPADTVIVALIINLPDKELLENHDLLINNETVDAEDHLNFDKSINITLADSFYTDENWLFLNFTANYTIKFVDPVSKTWAIDRLVALRNIRERIYFPSLISGPIHIYLSHISISEPTISSEDEVVRANSLFDRDVLYFEENITYNGDRWLKVELPYMVVGETCPFSVNYKALHRLRIIVTDNIKMPIMGLTLRIYYFNLNYGTYISNNRTQPIGPLKTNENGEVSINNILKGNYTVEVYQHGDLIIRTNVSTYNEVNYIYTNIMHIPIWILIFGSINAFILILGVIVYLKNKKSR
ncbi:MAG: hypothetical protein ACFE8L_11090, partial [Candidatus Hodarchaeota archaeon]